MWRKAIAGAILGFLLAGPLASSRAADTATTPENTVADTASTTPGAIVDRLHAALLDAMKDAKALGYAGRRQRLEPVIRSTFDLALMTQIVMGPAWPSLSPDDRTALVAAFSDYTIANYASRFDGWDGEGFVTGAQDDGGRGTIIVHTQLTSQNDQPVALDYRLRKADDGWRIIDVYADSAISELATRRSEFAAVLAQNGLAGLLDRLRQQTQALAQHG